jgi:hypothetical protein
MVTLQEVVEIWPTGEAVVRYRNIAIQDQRGGIVLASLLPFPRFPAGHLLERTISFSLFIRHSPAVFAENALRIVH